MDLFLNGLIAAVFTSIGRSHFRCFGRGNALASLRHYLQKPSTQPILKLVKKSWVKDDFYYECNDSDRSRPLLTRCDVS